MDIAIDAATDRLVRASTASPRLHYLCPCCSADVIIKAGPTNAPHFAHSKGEADPNCENYFSSSGLSGPYRTGVVQTARDDGTSDTSDLFFEFGVLGPRLAVWLPATGGDDSWTGSIRVEAPRLTRSLTAQHLRQGRFIHLALGQGTWTVSAIGEVSNAYRSRIGLGTNSLDDHLNLFDATRVPGGRIGPASLFGWATPFGLSNEAP